MVAPKKLVRLALAAILAPTLLVGCLPLPDVRGAPVALQAEPRVDPVTVRSRAVRVAGVDAPATPDAQDEVLTLRWALDEPAETVLVAMPGLFGGASSFAPFARRAVAATPGLQVWAIDRRGNVLEDRGPAIAAMRSGDPAVALRAYLGDGETPPTYDVPDPERYDHVVEWGLATTLGDLHAVVREAREAAPRVVLAGHSLGASLAGVYAAWRTPDGPGHEAIDGLVLVDGAPGRTGALDVRETVRIFGIPIVPTLEDVRTGRAKPWFTLGEGGATFARRQAASVAGALAPDADAPEEAADFPLSNRAFAGLAHDEQYGLLTAFGTSVGVVRNADLAGNLPAVLFAGRSAFRSASVVGVAEGAERVEWAPGDPTVERTDLDELLAAWTDPRADVAQWYMPWRMLLELAALGPDLLGHEAFVPMRDVTVPTLAVGAERGLLRDAAAFEGYVDQRLGSPVSVAILPGLTHLDVLTARENPLVPLVARWVSLLPAR